MSKRLLQLLALLLTIGLCGCVRDDGDDNALGLVSSGTLTVCAAFRTRRWNSKILMQRAGSPASTSNSCVPSPLISVLVSPLRRGLGRDHERPRQRGWRLRHFGCIDHHHRRA